MSSPCQRKDTLPPDSTHGLTETSDLSEPGVGELSNVDNLHVGGDSITVASALSVTPDAAEPVESLIAWHLLHPGVPAEPTELQSLRECLPSLFMSMQGVLEMIAEANRGTFQEAAEILTIKLENEADFPDWYSATVPKSRGRLDPENGQAFGAQLLNNARQLGYPAVFPHPGYWEHDLPSMAEAWASRPDQPQWAQFLVFGPTLGFQLSDIGSFLTRHGIKGFEAVQAAVIATEVSGPNGPAVEECSAAAPLTQREPAPEVVPSAKVSTVHSTRGGRTDLLRPLIELAISLAGGSMKAAVVWPQLERLAVGATPPAPLEGSDSRGIQYRADGKLKTFTKKQLGDRLLRRKTAR